jgi:hypothetical protein
MAKKKYTTKKYFPKDYPGFKLIKKFNKPRSPRTRMFACGDPDGWFIDVMEIQTKTGQVMDEEGWITERDVKQWTEWYKRLGWIEQEK